MSGPQTGRRNNWMLTYRIGRLSVCPVSRELQSDNHQRVAPHPPCQQQQSDSLAVYLLTLKPVAVVHHHTNKFFHTASDQLRAYYHVLQLRFCCKLFGSLCQWQFWPEFWSNLFSLRLSWENSGTMNYPFMSDFLKGKVKSQNTPHIFL